MKILSEFLTEYIKEYLFNGCKSLDKLETFDEQLQRVIHDGIFLYRRQICNSSGIILPDSEEWKIINALMAIENENHNDCQDKIDTRTQTR